MTFGLIVGFIIWSPFVVGEFERVLAHTSNNTLVLDRDGNLISAVEGLEDRHTIPITRISPYLQKAVVAIEDRRFFSHRGLDPIRFVGAVVANLRSMAYSQGFSTITQQLVKLTLLSPERTLKRKIKEVFMSIALELEYPKLKLLEFYLNRVYLGHGLYGVEKASQVYFQRSAADLTLKQASFLAALVKKPEGYLQYPAEKADPSSPYIPVKLLTDLRERQEFVITSLAQLGWVTQQEVQDANKEQMVVLKPKASRGRAQYFVQEVLKELKRVMDIPVIAGRGYRILTTLSADAQRKAEAIIAHNRQGTLEHRQVALVSMETATGQVLAMVGGTDFQTSQFNRATQALRQPGSAFKPILYATALENGFSPNTVFVDEPVRYVWQNGVMERLPGDELATEEALPTDVDLPDGTDETDETEGPKTYEPRNYDNHYGVKEMVGDQAIIERRMTLGRALERSSNVIAVQTLDRLGINPVVRLSRRLNLSVRPELGLCIALGCSETTLIDLTAAYSTLANKGTLVEPVLILKVTNPDGDVLYEYTPGNLPEVISPFNAYRITRMMTGVVQRGTGWRARLERPVAGKTGTNDGPRDAWFVGFTPTVATGVWIGFDNNDILWGEAGGKTPARLWKEFMKATLPPYQGETFQVPEVEAVAVRTCTVTGLLATDSCPSPRIYYYKENEAPIRVCDVHPRSGVFTDTQSSDPSLKFTRELNDAFSVP